MRLPSLLLFGLALLVPRVAHADTDPVVGTFQATGTVRGQPVSARLAIGRAGGDLRLLAEAGTARIWSGSAPSTGGPWRFVLDDRPGPSGFLGALAPVAPVASAARTLEVRPLPAGQLGAVLREGTTVTGSLLLSRARRSLVVPSALGSDSDQNAFRVYAREAQDFFRKRGFVQNDVLTGRSWDTLIATLERASATGHVYDRVVIVGHGGWDGPILDGEPYQASPRYPAEGEVFRRLATALRRGTSPDAVLVASGCHSGGSNAWEIADGGEVFRWADALAAASSRTVVGPAGITSTEYTLRLVQAVELEGPTVQETRIARGTSARTVRGGDRIAP